jgi:hypothetical protein
MESPRGFRARLRRTPGGALLLKAIVLVVGALFVGLGLVLVVLPGPLTIPPVLLGVYIWSTEFAWAQRLRDRASESARHAWATARERPVSSALVTAAGLLLAAAAIVAVQRYELVDRVTGSFG